MITQCVDAEFDRLMLTERAVARVHAFHGDVAAQFLLGDDSADGDEALSRLRANQAPYRCRDGSIVLTQSALIDEVLSDPRFASAPTGPGPRQYTLACVDEVIRAEAETTVSVPSVQQDTVDGLVARSLRTAAELDLVAEVIRPAVLDVLCEALGIGLAQRESQGETLHRLTRLAGCAMDAVVCAPRLTDAYALRHAVRELRERYGTAAGAIFVLGTELAVDITANAAAYALTDGQPAGDPATLVDRALVRYPPVRVHRLFSREPVDIAGHPIDAGTRVLVVNDPAWRDGKRAPALAIAAHPRLACLALPTATAVSAALCTHLRRLRPAGLPARRLRAPVTRAIVRLPVTFQPAGVQEVP